MKRFAGLLALLVVCVLPAGAGATPVCTDGYMGGPPASQCGGRIFPEAAGSVAYIQYNANPSGFREYQHGIEYLAQKYERWVDVFKLSDRYGKQAVTAGPDGKRATDPTDSGDGHEIWVVKLTDEKVPDKGKKTLFYSLSVHGNERGGLEGGMRTAEDLAIAATNGGKIADGVDNFTSTTGRKPAFHEYEVRDVLAKEVVYLVDLNIDGWAVGDLFNRPLPQLFARGNSLGTDLNRQMPTIGRIDPERNPLTETEAIAGKKIMDEVASLGQGGRMEYGADIHGELTSQAYMDIMYPAGQFDSVDHRRLMSIAERTKSVIDKTLYDGIIDEIEEASSGNEGEAASGEIPTKPAHWATVWDTLGYTDTGFIGDYLATETGVTGMDYEIFLNHSVPDKLWTVALQENHINATRGIIKTAMAYALTQQEEFSDKTVVLDPKGRPGYVLNPDTVTDKDENGPGTLPGPKKDGVGANGVPVGQAPYEASNTKFFTDQSKLMKTPFHGIASGDVATSLELVDSLVLADVALPADPRGRAVDEARYYAALRDWVERGGNLVLTDRAMHALPKLGLLGGKAGAVRDIKVYQPYANIKSFTHPMMEGLRSNARQLVEAAILGYGIGDQESPMTVVDAAAWRAAGGAVLGTTGAGSGATDDTNNVSIGELTVGKGKVRILGGALPTPSEGDDHRYGLRDYALTYTGLFIMENAVEHDVAGLGEKPLPSSRGAGGSRSCIRRGRLTVTVPRRTRKILVLGKRARSKRAKLTITVSKRRTKPVVVRYFRRGGLKTVTRTYKVCA